jgi:hypothetical protein
MKSKICVLNVLVLLILLIFASGSLAKKIPVSGNLMNADGKGKISNAKVTVVQGDEKFEQYTTNGGRFELYLNPGVANIIYEAPGYGKLEDRIIVAQGIEEFIKPI